MSFFQKPVRLKTLLIYIGGTLALAAVSALIAQTTFGDLVKPPLTPPGFLFPIVWTVLYGLMGLAAYRVSESSLPQKEGALRLYWIQLAVNLLWPIAFFRLEWRLFAFFWLLLLLALIVYTIARFGEIDRTAQKLLLPYLLWCSFAAYLNLGFYLLNR